LVYTTGVNEKEEKARSRLKEGYEKEKRRKERAQGKGLSIG